MTKKVYKLIVGMLFSFTLLFVGSVFAYENIPVYFNGKLMEFDVPAMTVNGRTMVPMRKIFEEFGMSVNWDDSTQTVTALKSFGEGKHDVIKMQIDNYTMTKNGETTDLDVAPMVLDGRTLVPVRAIAESMDANVLWNNDLRSVIITTEGTYICEEFPEVPDFGRYFGFEYNSKEISKDYGIYHYAIPEGYETKDEYAQNMSNIMEKLNYTMFSNSDVEFVFADLDGEYTATIKLNSIDDIQMIVEKGVRVYSGFNMKIVPESLFDETIAEGWKKESEMINEHVWISRLMMSQGANIPVDELGDDWYCEWFEAVVTDIDISGCILQEDGMLGINSVIINYNGKTYSLPLFKYTDELVKLNRRLFFGNPVEEYGITASQWEDVRRGKEWIGMPQELFELAYNREPDKINTTVTANGTFEQWVYIGSNYQMAYYYFLNGYLYEYQLPY